MANEMIQYEIEKEDETVRVSVPADWKVTFGPVAVGRNINGPFRSGNGSMALCFYENETKQRAIFTGVKSFRDTSLAIKRRVEVTQGEDKYTFDNHGNKQMVEQAAKQIFWQDVDVDPIEPDQSVAEQLSPEEGGA